MDPERQRCRPSGIEASHGTANHEDLVAVGVSLFIELGDDARVAGVADADDEWIRRLAARTERRPGERAAAHDRRCANDRNPGAKGSFQPAAARQHRYDDAPERVTGTRNTCDWQLGAACIVI